MEPGTRFCPNHPDLRFPTYAQECSVCNHPIERYPTIPGVVIAEPLEIVDDSPFLTAEEMEPILEAEKDLNLDRVLVSSQKKAPAKSHHKAKH